METPSHFADSDPLYVKQVVQTFLDGRKNARGRVMFAMLAGSYAFNLNIETSDKDYFAVYAADPYAAISLNPPALSVDSHDPDLACHEVGKFCRMLFKGNPKVIEPLFASHYCYASKEWEWLREHRAAFLTQTTVSQYLGYALAQIHDLDEGKGLDRAAKKYYHCIRILKDAERIASGGEPLVWLEGEDRDYLMRVRRDEVPVDELRAEVTALKRRITELKPSLPAKTPRAIVNDWLVRVRRASTVDVVDVGGAVAGGEGRKVNEKATKPDQTSAESAERGPTGASKEAHVLLHRVNAALAANGREGCDVLCCTPSGSWTHGLQREGSTVDYIAVFADPTDLAVALSPPPPVLQERPTAKPPKLSYASGLLLVEVGHAVAELSKGCFRLVELLHFVQPDSSHLPTHSTPEWELLVSLRATFVTQAAVRNAAGIAQGQLKRRDKGPVELYHAGRLLDECMHMLSHQCPSGSRLPADRHARLMALLEVSSAEEVDRRAADMVELIARDIVGGSALSSLPKGVDTAALNRWLYEVRRARWS